MSDPTDAQAVLAALRQLPLCDPLEACSPGGLQALAPLGGIESFATDELVFELGAPAGQLRFVTEGRVSLFLPDPTGSGPLVGTASRGDLLGWSALRDEGATWTVSARAARDTQCLVFDGAEVRDLCKREQNFGYCLMTYAFETIARRLADARLQLLDVYGDLS